MVVDAGVKRKSVGGSSENANDAFGDEGGLGSSFGGVAGHCHCMFKLRGSIGGGGFGFGCFSFRRGGGRRGDRGLVHVDLHVFRHVGVF